MFIVEDAVKIKAGYSEVIEGIEFRLGFQSISVYEDGIYVDSIEVDDYVTTSQLFQEQAMWWLHDYNRI